MKIKMNVLNTVAIFGLSAAVLASCGDKEKKNADTTPNVPTVRTDGLKIAYYNQDSITAGFEYYVEMDSIIKAKQIRFQKDFERREAELRNFLMNNDERDRRGELSMAQKQAIMEQAQRKEQELMQYQQSKGMEIEKETAEILEVISNKIEGAGRKYCEKHGIDVLLIQGKGGQINYINKSMDVTSKFLTFLNEYEADIQEDAGETKGKKK